MARPRARNGKDEATGFRDRGSDATIARGDRREAARAREHVRDTDSARKSTARAAPAFLLQAWHACDGQNEAVRFHDHDRGATSVRGEGFEAGRANERGSKIARARNGDAKTARTHKYNRASVSVATMKRLRALAKVKMATKPRVPAYAMVRSP
jgi:hypothetical protein